MKVKASFIAAVCFFTINIQAQNTENYAFKSGEKLQYDVFFNWGFIWITAANVDFTVSDATYNKTPVYLLKMAGKTAKAASMFSFTDTATVYVNKKTLKPYFFREASIEPNFYNINRQTFFSNDTVKWGVFVENERKNRALKRDTLTSNKMAYYDLYSTLYNLRNMNSDNWTINQKIPMSLIFSSDTLTLQLRYVGKEKITLKNGKTYNALKMKSALAEGKMFDKNEEMILWISDDKNHIPLMIESKLKVGAIKAQLAKVENNLHPIAETSKK